MAIIPNLSFADYCEMDALNASKLKAGRKSLAHMRLHRDDTKALRKGRGFHKITLEAALFCQEYVIGGPINPNTGKCYGSDTKKFEEWANAPERAGKEALTTEEYECIQKMRDAVMNHKTAGKIIEQVLSKGRVELTLTWEEQGLLCKARMDGYDGVSLAPDLKSTRDASKYAFTKAVAENGYHYQDHWYRRGAKANGLHVEGLPFIACESAEPFGVAVYNLTPEWRWAANEDISEIIPRYAEAKKTGVWPAYSQEVQEISCPAHIAGVLEAKI